MYVNFLTYVYIMAYIQITVKSPKSSLFIKKCEQQWKDITQQYRSSPSSVIWERYFNTWYIIVLALFSKSFHHKPTINLVSGKIKIQNLLLSSCWIKSWICEFLDYKACFDTRSRQILFRKLERYGVRGNFKIGSQKFGSYQKLIL